MMQLFSLLSSLGFFFVGHYSLNVSYCAVSYHIMVRRVTEILKLETFVGDCFENVMSCRVKIFLNKNLDHLMHSYGTSWHAAVSLFDALK